MNLSEYKALRASTWPASEGHPAPVSQLAEDKKRQERHPPGPSFELGRDTCKGEGYVYPVTVESPILAGLLLSVRVEYDNDTRESIEDEATNAGYTVQEVGRSYPDEDQQERPHHSAELVDIGEARGFHLVWVYFDDEIKAPAGMARGPAEEYRRAEARRYVKAMAKAMRERATGYLACFGVTLTASYAGAEVFSDSLWGIDADSAQEAARYYLTDYGIPAALHACANWRQEHAAHLAREAAKLAAQAADLLDSKIGE